MKKIIGFTSNNEIIVADVSFERVGNNKEPYFSACFDLSKIAKADETIRNYDYMYNYFEDVRYSYDPEYVLDLCDKYNCPPSELAELMTDEAINDDNIGMETLDCSLYPEIIEVDGEDYIFISTSCGQHDTRDEVDDFVDKKLYDDIHILWDNYHLKNIEGNEEAMNLYKSVLDRMREIDEEEVIVDYFRKSNFVCA